MSRLVRLLRHRADPAVPPHKHSIKKVCRTAVAESVSGKVLASASRQKKTLFGRSLKGAVQKVLNAPYWPPRHARGSENNTNANLLITSETQISFPSKALLRPRLSVSSNTTPKTLLRH